MKIHVRPKARTGKVGEVLGYLRRAVNSPSRRAPKRHAFARPLRTRRAAVDEAHHFIAAAGTGTARTPASGDGGAHGADAALDPGKNPARTERLKNIDRGSAAGRAKLVGVIPACYASARRTRSLCAEPSDSVILLYPVIQKDNIMDWGPGLLT
jgi:hypothetical protein